MAQEILLTGIVKNEDFMNFIKKGYQPPKDFKTLMMLETQPRYLIEPDKRQELLIFAPFRREFDFTSYTSGRIFHNRGELRWELSHSLVKIVYTGSVMYKPTLQAMQEMGEETLDNCNAITREYFLFGKRLDKEQIANIGPNAQEGDFAEVRIPRLLRYPASINAERVQIAVCEYIHRATGTNAASRFYDLIPFNKSQEQKSA